MNKWQIQMDKAIFALIAITITAGLFLCRIKSLEQTIYEQQQLIEQLKGTDNE